MTLRMATKGMGRLQENAKGVAPHEETSRYYDNFYEEIHYKGAMGRYSELAHWFIEKRLKTATHYSQVLEIGAGSGEHLKQVRHSFDRYVCLDIYPPKIPKKFHKVEFIQGDAEEMPFDNNTFDRILNVCVLHHVGHVEKVAQEMLRVSKDGAILNLYVSCDPGMIYRWIRHWSSHLKTSLKMNVSMRETKYLWALEHRSNFLAIKSILYWIFRDHKVSVRRFPFPYLSWNFNLFTVFEIKIKKS